MFDKETLDMMKQQMMRQARNYTYKELQEIADSSKNPMIFYHTPRKDVENLDYKGIEQLLNNVQMVGKPFRGKLVLTVDGYDDTPDELYEIEDVRKYTDRLFNKYPHIFYYIHKEFEADVWLLNCFVDEVTSIKRIEDIMTPYELYEKFGLDHHLVPKVQSKLTVSNDKLVRMLKAVLKHGKMKKDIRGAKKVVVHYALKFDNPLELLDILKIKPSEAFELMKEIEDEKIIR